MSFFLISDTQLPQNECPIGYIKAEDNIPDVGTALGIHIAKMEACGSVCLKYPECVSFEHSYSQSRCILNPRGELQGRSNGYVFCYNIGTRNHIQHMFIKLVYLNI